MRHLATYMLLVLGGNASPTKEDVTTALAAVGIEVSYLLLVKPPPPVKKPNAPSSAPLSWLGSLSFLPVAGKGFRAGLPCIQTYLLWR